MKKRQSFDSRKLDDKTRYNLKGMILSLGTVQYVEISPDTQFFIIKFPTIQIKANEYPRRNHHYAFPQLDGPGKRHSAPENFCGVYHQGKLYLRWTYKEVENYLKMTPTDTPEFLVESHFIIRERYDKGDILVPRENINVSFPEYFKPIKDLLRKIGLLEEKRSGKNKPVDSINTLLKDFLVAEFKKDPTIKTLKLKLDAKVDKLWKKGVIGNLSRDSFKPFRLNANKIYEKLIEMKWLKPIDGHSANITIDIDDLDLHYELKVLFPDEFKDIIKIFKKETDRLDKYKFSESTIRRAVK